MWGLPGGCGGGADTAVPVCPPVPPQQSLQGLLSVPKFMLTGSSPWPWSPSLHNPDPSPCPARPRLKSTQNPRSWSWAKKALKSTPGPLGCQMNSKAPRLPPSPLATSHSQKVFCKYFPEKPLAGSGSNLLPWTLGQREEIQGSSPRTAPGPGNTVNTSTPSDTEGEGHKAEVSTVGQGPLGFQPRRGVSSLLHPPPPPSILQELGSSLHSQRRYYLLGWNHHEEPVSSVQRCPW